MRVVFRCDASKTIGLGHVARCLNLAHFVREAGGTAVFAMREGLPSTLGWRADGIEEVLVSSAAGKLGQDDADLVLQASTGADWIVVDSYDATDAYLERIATRCPLLVIDDLADRSLSTASLVVNPTLGSETFPYRLARGRLLAGPSYALLHPAFASERPASLARRKSVDKLAQALVVMGGSDAGELTAAIVVALHDAGVREVRAVLGPAAASSFTATEGVTVFQSQSPERMAEHMGWADLAVATPSTLAWELATVGVPSVVIPIADNQRENARVLRERDLCRVATRATLADAIRAEVNLDRITRNQRIDHWAAIGDGLGSKRVFDEMKQITERSIRHPYATGESDRR